MADTIAGILHQAYGMPLAVDDGSWRMPAACIHAVVEAGLGDDTLLSMLAEVSTPVEVRGRVHIDVHCQHRCTKQQAYHFIRIRMPLRTIYVEHGRELGRRNTRWLPVAGMSLEGATRPLTCKGSGCCTARAQPHASAMGQQPVARSCPTDASAAVGTLPCRPVLHTRQSLTCKSGRDAWGQHTTAGHAGSQDFASIAAGGRVAVADVEALQLSFNSHVNSRAATAASAAPPRTEEQKEVATAKGRQKVHELQRVFGRAPMPNTRVNTDIYNAIHASSRDGLRATWWSSGQPVHPHQRGPARTIWCHPAATH